MKHVFHKILLMLIAIILSSQNLSADQIPIIARLCMGDSLDNFGGVIEPAGDMNDDGFKDIWVMQNYYSDAISGRSVLYLFYGGNPMDSIPDLVINDTIYSIVNVGDMNQDSFDDFIIMYGGATKYLGLHFGGLIFNAEPDLIFPIFNQHQPSYGFPKTIDGGKDVDKDGLPDLLVGEPVASLEYCGKVYLYSSFPIFDTVYDKEYSVDGVYPYYYAFGLNVKYISNINNKQYIAISRHGNVSHGTTGAVFLFETEPQPFTSNIDSTPDIKIDPPFGLPIATFGSLLENVGDMNADGFEDIVISTIMSADGWFYSGNESFDTIPDVTIVPSFEHLEPIGDVNNDTYPDFIIGEQPFNGRAWIYYGGPGFDGIVDMKVDYLGWEINNFGKNIKGLGDVNGDGIDDFAVAALFEDDDYWYWPGIVYVYAGYDGTPTNVVQIEEEIIPKDFRLSQNYPNPFNHSTVIEFEIPYRQHIRLEIYNIHGEKIKTLVNDIISAGVYRTEWDGTNKLNIVVSSGIYIYILTGIDTSVSKKMILLK